MNSMNFSMFFKILMLQFFLNHSFGRIITNNEGHRIKRKIALEGEVVDPMLRRLPLPFINENQTDEKNVVFPLMTVIVPDGNNLDLNMPEMKTFNRKKRTIPSFEHATLNNDENKQYSTDELINLEKQNKILKVSALDMPNFLRKKRTIFSAKTINDKKSTMSKKFINFRQKRESPNTRENKVALAEFKAAQMKAEFANSKNSTGSKAKRALSSDMQQLFGSLQYYNITNNGTYTYSNSDPQNLFSNIGEDIVDWEKYMLNGMSSGSGSGIPQLNSLFGWSSTGSQTTTAKPNLISRVSNFFTSIPTAVVGFFQNVASFLTGFTG